MNRTMLRVAFLAVFFVAFGVAKVPMRIPGSRFTSVSAPLVVPAPVVVAPPPYPHAAATTTRLPHIQATYGVRAITSDTAGCLAPGFRAPAVAPYGRGLRQTQPGTTNTTGTAGSTLLPSREACSRWRAPRNRPSSLPTGRAAAGFPAVSHRLILTKQNRGGSTKMALPKALAA